MATSASPINAFVTSPATVSSLGDGYSANTRFIELQKELRYVLSAGVTSLAPSRAASPEDQDAHHHDEDRHGSHAIALAANGQPIAHHTGSSNILATIQLPDNISKLAAINYLRNWIKECAGFLDKFDEKQHFGVQVPILAQNSPALLHAVLAFSARQTERKNAVTTGFDSLELYQESIRLLSPSLQARDPNVLVTVCILACLELMSGSPKDWKRHLEGCAILFDSFGVTGFSGGLLQAVFWCYARMELCGVIIANYLEATVLPLEKWTPGVPQDYFPSPISSASSRPTSRSFKFVHDLFLDRSRQCPDMHANWSVYLCTQACDLLRRQIRQQELGENESPVLNDDHDFITQWQWLWSELQFWLDHRPSELLPVTTTKGQHEHDQPQPLFPQVFFTHWAAISSNQLYHTACIILLDSKSLLARAPDGIGTSDYSPAHSPTAHAKHIVGISLTNPHLGNLVNAIHPLYIAGQYLSHLDEHLAVGRLLKKIDRSTGWGALWRLRDLEAVWGYDVGEIVGVV